ncbi:MAG: B3/4 domain-containing protein [Bacilli bacterium]|nr:B3/4 domain-containing protein [Bacilli bacterium]
MKRFIVEKDFWDIFPNAKIGIIVCNNVDNHIIDENKYMPLIDEASLEANKYFNEEEFSNNSVVHIWREAYQKFKTKKGARSSVEALLKRVYKQTGINPINPLVDIYNSISIKYGMPCGGEDIDKFVGDIRLTKAIGNESFVTYGTDESEPPYEGEIVYKDEKGAICRCFNWRECVRTMLTEDTVNVFLCIELIDPSREEEFMSALEELANLVATNLNGDCKINVLDIDNSEIVIEK